MPTYIASFVKLVARIFSFNESFELRPVEIVDRKIALLDGFCLDWILRSSLEAIDSPTVVVKIAPG